MNEARCLIESIVDSHLLTNDKALRDELLGVVSGDAVKQSDVMQIVGRYHRLGYLMPGIYDKLIRAYMSILANGTSHQ